MNRGIMNELLANFSALPKTIIVGLLLSGGGSLAHDRPFVRALTHRDLAIDLLNRSKGLTETPIVLLLQNHS